MSDYPGVLLSYVLYPVTICSPSRTLGDVVKGLYVTLMPVLPPLDGEGIIAARSRLRAQHLYPDP
jgi:hypothetical protein